jgi:Spy/CpxP family protein refolding chaperone
MFENKRLRKILGTAAIFTLAVAGWSGAVWAQGQAAPPGPAARAMRGMRMGPGFMLGRMARQLGLTAQQRQDIRAVVQSHRDQLRTLMQENAKLRRQLRAAVQNDDQAAINALAVPLGQAEANMATLRAQIHSEVMSKLTPAQQDKAKQLQQQFQERLQQRRQRMQQRMQNRANNGGAAR